MHTTAALLIFSFSLSAVGADVDCPLAGEKDRTECLNKGLRTAELDLQDALAQVTDRIESHAEMGPAMRKNWKNAVSASQRFWTQHTEMECELIVPYLQRGALDIADSSTQCLLAKTTARTRELREAYRLK